MKRVSGGVDDGFGERGGVVGVRAHGRDEVRECAPELLVQRGADSARACIPGRARTCARPPLAALPSPSYDACVVLVA